VNALLLILRASASMTGRLAPYVVLGVLLSEALRYTSAASLLGRICRQQPAVAVPLSALLGMASPLCTYGTVPLVLHLLRSGVPLAPLATFLSASSLMNPQLFLITWGGLGPKMAIARVVVVFGFGLLLGGVLHVLPPRLSVQPLLRQDHEKHGKHGHPFNLKAFAVDSFRTLEFVGFYVLLGVLIGASIEVLVPARWILLVFGTGGWVQILVAALFGLPLYACGGGTIPVVEALLGQGMAQGAALAFLIAGPATRIPPLMALATIIRPVLVVIYVVVLVAYSVVAGLLYGLI
jgi:uncharacterized membrane protein YraQ (UPF0718 family)